MRKMRSSTALIVTSQDYWNDLHNFQEQFLTWFKAFDSKDDKSPQWNNPYEDYSTSKIKVNINEVPVYSERIVPFTQRLSRSGIYIALLLVYTATLFYTSFVLFVTYDVRWAQVISNRWSIGIPYSVKYKNYNKDEIKINNQTLSKKRTSLTINKI